MKTLPKNICAHPDGFLVRVQRGEFFYQAFVPKGAPDALGRAIALRDKVLNGLPQIVVRSNTIQPRSNTGISGISETVTWRHGKPYNCFNVAWWNHAERKARMTRLYYKADWSNRDAVLQRAIELRATKIKSQNA